MAVHYLIDGYNLIYAFPSIPAGTWEQKRDYLLAYLGEKRPQGNNPVTVVYDSRQGLGDKLQQGSVTIIFTAGESADDHLSAMVRKVPNPRSLIVVTNDRGLQAQVRGTGARCVSSTAFLKGSGTPLPSPGPRKKIPPPDSQDITEEFKKKWL